MKRGDLLRRIRAYAGVPRGQLAGRLEADLRANPDCPVVRYLIGCQYFDRGRPASAVRHLMIAYRIYPAFESAAFLVFAGLNWLGKRDSSLLAILLETWEEFRRPRFDRHPDERALLDALNEPDPGLASRCMLAGRLWRLPISTLRAQLRAALALPQAELHPLLTVPA